MRDIEKLTEQERIYLISELVKGLKREEGIPSGIFDNKKLSCLEAIAKYLREEKKLRYVKIARLLNRSDKTIWVTYQKAKKKMPERLPIGGEYIPLSRIANRKYAVLEAVVGFMKDENELEYKEIARMLNRAYSTIAGTYRRYKLR